MAEAEEFKTTKHFKYKDTFYEIYLPVPKKYVKIFQRCLM